MYTSHLRKFMPIAGIAAVLLASVGQAAPHPRGIHNSTDLAFVTKQVTANRQPWKSAYTALISHADKALSYKPQAMEDFNVPGYYGSRQEQHNTMKGLLSSDASAAYVSALAWQLAQGSHAANREKYGQKALEILNNWGGTNKKFSGADGNLVMSYNGVMLGKAGDLMYNYGNWKADDKTAFAGWVRNVLLKAGESIEGRDNNWGDWGLVAVAVSACFLDDEQRLKALSGKLSKKIVSSIKADGSMPKETGRGENGIWYTYFALAPLTEAIEIVRRNTGVNLFDTAQPNGQLLKKGLDYLLKYSLNPGAWPHSKATNLPKRCSDCWPGNMFEAMADIYDSKEYESFAAPGRPYFRKSTGLVWSMTTLFKETHGTDAKVVTITRPRLLSGFGPSDGRQRLMPNGRTISSDSEPTSQILYRWDVNQVR